MCAGVFGQAEVPWVLPTRVAAEGQFPSGRVGLSNVEIPVFVNPQCGSVRVPAGVGKKEVLKAGQHLNRNTENNKVALDWTVSSSVSRNDWSLCQRLKKGTYQNMEDNENKTNTSKEYKLRFSVGNIWFHKKK